MFSAIFEPSTPVIATSRPSDRQQLKLIEATSLISKTETAGFSETSEEIKPTNAHNFKTPAM
jgi:hypothetical protein